jgi:RNA polymerase sigma-70 factor (ECF subfamily)
MEFDISDKDKLNKLAKRMKRGDMRAAEEMHRELGGKVFGFCMNRVFIRATAEDLTQDIFIKLLDKLGSFDPKKGNFIVWFWRLARNTVIDHYREKKQTSFADMGEGTVESIESGEQHPHHLLDQKFERERLQAFVNTLGDEEKNVFEFRFVAELSYAEVAELTGKSEGSLRVTVNRLRKKIQKQFNN